MRRTLHITLALAVTACVGQAPDGPPVDGGVDAPPAVVCEATRSYDGFGPAPLEADRMALEAGRDRLRIKPFTALATEYQRALGLATFNTNAYAATFGRPPARWYLEPAASANTVYAAFALAYAACTQKTATDATYAEAPTPATAELVCNTHIRAAWHREPTPEETAACAVFTVDQTSASDPPRTRWAYSCAAVLSASGFLAY